MLWRKGIVLEAQSRAQEVLTATLEGETREIWQRLTQHRGTLARLLLHAPEEQSPPDYRRTIQELSVAITREEEFLAQRSSLVAQTQTIRQVTAPLLAAHLP